MTQPITVVTTLTTDPSRLVEAVREGNGRLDGAMSPQTVALLERFKTRSLYMTELWAMTPQAWECPGCGRKKAEIVRLNRHGELMCILMEHHDHMVDALEEYFVLHSTSGAEVVADALCGTFARRSADMVSAYDRTLMCQDCNSADPAAKKLVGAPKYLSFSPAEIRRFVIARPNEDHRIDEDAARAVYDEILPTFEIRMRFVNGIARMAARDTHWFQPSDEGSKASQVRQAAESKLKSHGYIGGVEILCGTRRAGNHSFETWRTKRWPKAKRTPTPAQIQHVAKAESQARWAALPDDWQCPGCNRAKALVVRPSNKSVQFTFLASPRVFLAPPGMKGPHRVDLCGDCWEAGTALGREACHQAGMTRSQYLQCIRLTELRAIVRPQPHARHNIDADAVAHVLAGVIGRISQSPATPGN